LHTTVGSHRSASPASAHALLPTHTHTHAHTHTHTATWTACALFGSCSARALHCRSRPMVRVCGAGGAGLGGRWVGLGWGPVAGRPPGLPVAAGGPRCLLSCNANGQRRPFRFKRRGKLLYETDSNFLSMDGAAAGSAAHVGAPGKVWPVPLRTSQWLPDLVHAQQPHSLGCGARGREEGQRSCA
jgi:hypothetical protein